MATSGTIYTVTANYSKFYLSWQLADQDVANNRSLIKWQAGLQITNSAWWGSNAVKINSIHVNGGSSLGSGTWSNISGNGNHQLKSGSKWVTHNSDGTKSFGADLSGWLYANGNLSTNGSWSLPTIPRNSQVSTNDSGHYDLGTALTITTNRKSSSFTHTITIRMDNSGGTVLHTFNSVGASVKWTPSDAEVTTMQNHIPDDNSLKLYIDQYNNQVKEHSHVIVTTYLRDANPTFADFSYKDSDSTTVGVTGNDQVLVKGKSVLEVDVTTGNAMEAIKGASEDHYAIAYDGASKLEDYSDSATVSASFSSPQTIGGRTILVSAYDSRGNSTTISKNVTVYDYTAPVITTTLTRENNFGEDTTVHIEGTYTPLVIGGTAKNSPQTDTLQYRYAEDGESMGSWTTVSFTDNGDGTYSVVDFVVSLDNSKKYDFEFQINDSFGTATTSNSVDVGTPVMFVGQNSGNAQIGIGKMPETDGDGDLDVAGNIYSNGKNVNATFVLGLSRGGTTSSTTSTTPVEIPDGDITVDIPYGVSMVKITYQSKSMFNTGASGYCLLSIYKDSPTGTLLAVVTHRSSNANDNSPASIVAVDDNVSSGSQKYVVTYHRAVGTAAGVEVDTTSKQLLMVEAIG